MSNKSFPSLILISVISVFSCTSAQTSPNIVDAPSTSRSKTVEKIKNSGRVIHVMVALCDNENQGIVPVPAHLGNGEDTEKNLYWGAAYGVRTFFSKSKNWKKLAELQNPKADVLQRVVFKHNTQNVYLVADAYRGSRMKSTIDDFFSAVSGKRLENVELPGLTLQVMGSAGMVVFVGHNGLMDAKLETSPKKYDDEKRDAVILACASRSYFSPHLKNTGAEPLLWTSNLMAPEAYTLHDAIEGWIINETPQQVRVRAAAAYARYQKISRRSAQNLLITGW
jgi:hypothetical protein